MVWIFCYPYLENYFSLFRRTPVHLVTRKEFPPLLGRRKEQFLGRKDTVAFLVVRDPFERILSSYKVSMTVFDLDPRVYKSIGAFDKNAVYLFFLGGGI